ncbi:hypothetical protein DESAMIL20_614 [Desulfurella amilsii]|uniref:Uncharacterized protein n=1 Tax=Desulfurella amilsii TaxID=1562698 RepID=A0A1X4XYE5_9BACT|nr:hypothetical protein DESAMIL20_614 [Desulfurella amilsii]
MLLFIDEFKQYYEIVKNIYPLHKNKISLIHSGSLLTAKHY